MIGFVFLKNILFDNNRLVARTDGHTRALRHVRQLHTARRRHKILVCQLINRNGCQNQLPVTGDALLLFALIVAYGLPVGKFLLNLFKTATYPRFAPPRYIFLKS